MICEEFKLVETVSFQPIKLSIRLPIFFRSSLLQIPLVPGTTIKLKLSVPDLFRLQKYRKSIGFVPAKPAFQICLLTFSE
jgi:hypothetical protein